MALHLCDAASERDLITGMIKANFPTRFAFRARRRSDSRNDPRPQGRSISRARRHALKLNCTNDTNPRGIGPMIP